MPQWHLAPMNEARHAQRANWTTLQLPPPMISQLKVFAISFPRRRPTFLGCSALPAGVLVDATHARARCVHILMRQH